MTALDLTGLSAGPAQVWGGIRLVPLLRAEPVAGLRLHREAYGSGDFATEDVRLNDGAHYTSYIPHGFVADWSGEGTAAAYGTSLGGAAPAGRVALHRMAKRRPGDRLRFLPLHLALEGYLALHFGGPSTLWDTWSREALRSGLSPRVESAYLGADVPGLADALRVFEIHPRQCGVLVYAADALGAAFAVPHPDDYRALHATLLQDLFGELIHQYALFGRPVAGVHRPHRGPSRARHRRSARGGPRAGAGLARGARHGRWPPSCTPRRTPSAGCTGWAASTCGASCRRSSAAAPPSTSARRSPTARAGWRI